LEVEAKLDLLIRRIERPDRETDDTENDEDFPTKVLRHDLCIRRVDNRRLSLVADDRGAGNVDPDVRGNLKLNGVFADLGDRAEDAAGGHDLVAFLERGEKRLDL